jgi:hypothetical protein
MRSYAYRLLGFLALRSLRFTIRRLDRFGLPLAGRMLAVFGGLGAFRAYRLLGFLVWKTLRFTVRRLGN